ncbi:MAG: MFS transporter, partial [Oscillospiraceae bacterium]|nr:MFS transporter [Oscillospiraceae bacterium]
MSDKIKIRDPEHMGVKEVFGVTSLSMISSITAIFMSSLFMQYMTDYAGLGAWGATLATTLLLVARIIDAVDDPIQGFIMDNARIGKHGKYKPFYLL